MNLAEWMGFQSVEQWAKQLADSKENLMVGPTEFEKVDMSVAPTVDYWADMMANLTAGH